MNKQKLTNLLAGYDELKVSQYVAYCDRLETEKDSKGALKNAWFTNKKDEQLAEMFKGVLKDGLEFDGKHITIQKTGVSYDYQAYKNKMFLVYPESIIDIGLVKENDVFSFSKDSGHVNYKHVIGNPFGNEQITGAYCVIKNKRGEFLTLLSKEDIAKHRKVAKTDMIWNQWYEEMCLKTIIKKGCSKHFGDIYQNIETIDNENYDLENPLEITVEMKSEIENIATLEELDVYYEKHLGKESEFSYDPPVKAALIKTLTQRKKEIKEGF